MGSMRDKSELEKCLAGEVYDCHAAVFLEFKAKTRRLLAEYNRLAYEEKEKKRAVLQEMLGGIGTNVSIGRSSAIMDATSISAIMCPST